MLVSASIFLISMPVTEVRVERRVIAHVPCFRFAAREKYFFPLQIVLGTYIDLYSFESSMK